MATNINYSTKNELYVLLLIPIIIFFTNLAYPKGFFVDEFDYFNSEIKLNDITRLPLVPATTLFLTSILGHETGLNVFKTLAWMTAFFGILALNFMLLPKEKAIYSTVISTIWFDFLFYSGKVLTETLLIGLVALSVCFAIKIVKDNKYSHFWLFLFLLAIGAGLLTKITFLAIIPLLAIGLLFYHSDKVFIGIIGFGWIALLFATNLTFNGGIERYALPAIPLILIFVFSCLNEKQTNYVAFSLILLNFILLLGLMHFQNSKFIEYKEEAKEYSELNSNQTIILTNQPKYVNYYWPEAKISQTTCEFTGNPGNYVILSKRSYYEEEKFCYEKNIENLKYLNATKINQNKWLEIYLIK